MNAGERKLWMDARVPVMIATVALVAAGTGGMIGYWAGMDGSRSNAERAAPNLQRPNEPPVQSWAGLEVGAKPAGAVIPGGAINGPTPWDWSQVESRDFKQYIANLRAIGCPERTIRDIIRADVERVYGERHRALATPPSNHERYWEPRRGWGPKAEYEKREKHRALDREQQALMAELLGPAEPGPAEAGSGPGGAAPGIAGNDAGQWSPEAEQQVHAIQEKYLHLREEIFHESEGRIYPADAARLLDLHKQRVTELSEVLSPEQLREFELREGPIADHLRQQLEPFQPSEAEFRAIHEVRQSFVDELGVDPIGFEDPDYHRAREQVEQRMSAELETVLGEERFAQYQQSTDPHFRDLYALGERFELPPENVNQMYDLWRTSEQMVDQVHANPELPPEQKHEILRGFRGELEAEAQQILGEQAYFNYRSRGGEWMRHLFGGEEPGE